MTSTMASWLSRASAVAIIVLSGCAKNDGAGLTAGTASGGAASGGSSGNGGASANGGSSNAGSGGTHAAGGTGGGNQAGSGNVGGSGNQAGSGGESGSRPTLADVWLGKARFGDEQRVCASSGPSDPSFDFHYQIDGYTSAAVIEAPPGSGTVYYVCEHWKGSTDEILEPHIWKSTDGGHVFAPLGRVFDVGKQCSAADPTAARWDFQNQTWCIFQMREADVAFHDGSFVIVYEASAKNAIGQYLQGPAVVRLSSLDIAGPQTVQYGVNFRQHPLMAINLHDADPALPGSQTISGSTPVWFFDAGSAYVFWVGVFPAESQWQRVDSYRGHFSSQPGSSLADCTDPVGCFFVPDEWDVSNPNFAHGPAGAFDGLNAEVRSVVREGSTNYLYYGGGPSIFPEQPGIAQSAGTTHWQRAYGPGQSAPGFYTPQTGGGHYGKLVKIGPELFMYFVELRAPGPPGNPTQKVLRAYRRRLLWNFEPDLPDTSPCYL